MTRISIGLIVAVAACGPETTSFRATDQGDGTDRAGRPAAAYTVKLADQTVATVHVWSSGGYISSTDEPMTHVGFEIKNTGTRAVTFDGDALELVVFDRTGMELPPTAFTSLTPLGPAQVPIAAGTTAILDGYFRLPVRPRVVDAMRVRWSLHAGDQRHVQLTSFTRDDDFPVLDRPPGTEVRPTVHARR